jgi:1,2-diacylglycerol 3-beta-glucosyltransferase
MTFQRGLHMLAAALLLPATLVLGLVGGYLGGLTVAAWRVVLRGRPGTDSSSTPFHRFLVLVPAHNEEHSLSRTLRSLAAISYPATHVAVHVVADNCEDATADVARSEGAEVHERRGLERPGKGPALAWLLQRLWDRGEIHDAVAIVDADTVVDKDFFRVMNAALARGDRVIQGHYAVLDPDASWAVAIRYAALAARHYLRPLARTSFGGSAGLHGNGMVFSGDLLRRHRWASHLTEDIELEARLLLDGHRVAFAPDARIEAEMPIALEQARSQHERWERGRLDVARRYVPQFLRAAAKHPDPVYRVRFADAAMDHLVPPLSALAALTVVASGLSIGLRACRATPLSRVALPVAAGTAAVQVAYVVSALRMVNAPSSVWRSLLRAPELVLSRLWAWTRTDRRRDPAWTRTPRNIDPQVRGMA